MKLSSIMTGGIETIPPQASLAEAARKMASQDIGSLPVCAEPRRVVGIITDRDITVRAVARGMRQMELGIDLILTSPLPRALQTAEIVAAELRMPMQALRQTPALEPGATRTELFALLDEVDLDRDLLLIRIKDDDELTAIARQLKLDRHPFIKR